MFVTTGAHLEMLNLKITLVNIFFCLTCFKDHNCLKDNFYNQ